MKLHIENIESKFEYFNKMKKENKYLNEKIKKLNDSKKENEIIILKTENKNLKDIINQKENEMLRNEKEFMDKISDLNKKLLNYEDIMKYQSSKVLVESDNDRNDRSVIFKIFTLLFIIYYFFFFCLIKHYSNNLFSKYLFRLINLLTQCIRDQIAS